MRGGVIVDVSLHRATGQRVAGHLIPVVVGEMLRGYRIVDVLNPHPGIPKIRRDQVAFVLLAKEPMVKGIVDAGCIPCFRSSGIYSVVVMQATVARTGVVNFARLAAVVSGLAAGSVVGRSHQFGEDGPTVPDLARLPIHVVLLLERQIARQGILVGEISYLRQLVTETMKTLSSGVR